MTSRLLWIIFILIAVQVARILTLFTDVPPPPIRPERFNSREDLKRYLQLVHEYYAVIGRPRFGRDLTENGFNLNGRRLKTLLETIRKPYDGTEEQMQSK